MNDNLSGDMANMNSAFEEMQLQAFERMEQPLRDGAQYITGTVIPILTGWVPDAFGALADGAAKLGRLTCRCASSLYNSRILRTRVYTAFLASA